MLHYWFEEQKIEHKCKITDEQYEIYGIRYEQYDKDQDHYAVVYDARSLSGFKDYQTIISHRNNMLLFPDSSPDTVLNQANYMMSTWRDWEDKLKKINISKGSVNQIFRQTEKVLPMPILLLRGQRIMAVSELWSEEIRQIYMTFRQTDYEVICKEDKKGGILEELYSHRSIQMVQKPYWNGRNRILCNIWIHGMCLLRLLVFDRKDQTIPCDLHTIDELAKSIGNSVRQNMDKYFRNDMPDMTLQSFFVKKQVDEERLLPVLKKRNWSRSDQFLCYCIETNLSVSVFGMEKLMEEIRIHHNQWCVFFDRVPDYYHYGSPWEATRGKQMGQPVLCGNKRGSRHQLCRE